MSESTGSFTDYSRADAEVGRWTGIAFHEKTDRHVQRALQNKQEVLDKMLAITKPNRSMNWPIGYVLAQMAKTDPRAKAKFGLRDRDMKKFCWQVMHGRRRTTFKDEVRQLYVKMRLKDEV